jgi:nucleotide-binding universal stress UspA family protein
MTAITRILVPVDFSTHAERATDYAVTLGRTFGACVELLHVVEDPFAAGGWGSEMYITDIDGIRKRAMAEATTRLEAYKVAIPAQEIPFVTNVRMGHVAQTIVEYAQSIRADLIVMGTHGRTGLAHFIIGSVAERVVRLAPCPVLTVGVTGAAQKATAAA